MKKLFAIILLFFLQAIIAQNNSELDYAYKEETSHENIELKKELIYFQKKQLI